MFTAIESPTFGLTKAKRWGLYGGKHPRELAKICETADMEL